MKRIEAILTDEFMFDDCQETKEFIEEFQSVVYESYKDYVADLLVLSQNDDFKFALPHETDSHFPRRTAEERQDIIIKKVHARRRYQEHLENGGSEDETSGALSDFPLKKAHH
ncbi:hypothetical protein BTO01_28515 [Vibrio jasicida]|uniref:hypothetical protein n=1 Tax=Vibrio harveyi group TaxID=717610 RepID=UPI000CF55ED3|nr:MULTISPECIES: hypothetical protein [Vibrio harveyi group]PQJ47726.1 hypothetical protein BTO01_28515 [Vibrio jasicida]UMM07065.1 hypothetical protein MKR81_28350 [Vibrio campbellii]